MSAFASINSRPISFLSDNPEFSAPKRRDIRPKAEGEGTPPKVPEAKSVTNEGTGLPGITEKDIIAAQSGSREAQDRLVNAQAAKIEAETHRMENPQHITIGGGRRPRIRPLNGNITRRDMSGRVVEGGGIPQSMGVGGGASPIPRSLDMPAKAPKEDTPPKSYDQIQKERREAVDNSRVNGLAAVADLKNLRADQATKAKELTAKTEAEKNAKLNAASNSSTTHGTDAAGRATTFVSSKYGSVSAVVPTEAEQRSARVAQIMAKQDERIAAEGRPSIKSRILDNQIAQGQAPTPGAGQPPTANQPGPLPTFDPVAGTARPTALATGQVAQPATPINTVAPVASVSPPQIPMTPSLENALFDKKYGTNSWEAQRQKSIAKERRDIRPTPMEDGINAAGAAVVQSVSNAFKNSPGMKAADLTQKVAEVAGKTITDPEYAKNWSSQLGDKVNSIMPQVQNPGQAEVAKKNIRPTPTGAAPAQEAVADPTKKKIRPMMAAGN